MLVDFAALLSSHKFDFVEQTEYQARKVLMFSLIFCMVIKFYERKNLITWFWFECGQNSVWPYTATQSHCEILELT